MCLLLRQFNIHFVAGVGMSVEASTSGGRPLVRLHLNGTLQAIDDLNLCVIIVYHYYCISFKNHFFRFFPL